MNAKQKNDARPNSPVIHVAPSPHMFNMGMTIHGMMRDVIIALTPLVIAAVLFFKWAAVMQLLICVTTCLGAELVFTRMCSKPVSVGDFSAVVTGLILGLSLPATAPWYVGCIGAMVAMGIGKMVFGGVGMNIFNPAMVGRAFVMISFAGSLGASGYVDLTANVDILSQATPLTAHKLSNVTTSLAPMFWGYTNGSLGETSVPACLLGGLYLCVRRVASWEIPAGMIAASVVIGGIVNLTNPADSWTVVHHVMGGALLFGAFFIATDPVTSPLTPRGKWIFGIGIGVLVMILRLFSGYPEGLMFAVLLMNALTPLINRWTIPRPFGGV